MMSGIYRIRHLETGQCYYGRSRHLEHRWDVEHLPSLRSGTHHNRHLQSAFSKFGERTFIFEIVEEVDVDSLVEREQWYLDNVVRPFLDYNINTNADRGGSSTPRSQSTKDKISKSLSGRTYSLETIQKFRNKRVTDESKEKIRQYRLGRIRPHSKETRRKISETKIFLAACERVCLRIDSLNRKENRKNPVRSRIERKIKIRIFLK